MRSVRLNSTVCLAIAACLFHHFVASAGAQAPNEAEPPPSPAEVPPAFADVRAYGAVGDGAADCAAAFERAIASGIGVVRVPSGTFRLERTVEIDLAKTGPIAIQGSGVGRVLMAGAGPAFRFVGSHVKGSADPTTFDADVLAKERMPTVDGVEFVGAHEEADAVEARGTMQLTLTRCRVTDCRHGVHLVERNRNLLVSDCHFYKNRGVGIFYDEVSLHQSNIVGCHISYCGGGGIVSRGGDVRNIHIGTCDLESNHATDGEPTANILIDCRTSTNGTAEVAIVGCTIQHQSKAPRSANVRILGRGLPDPLGAESTGARFPVRDRRWGHVTIIGNVFSDVRTNVHLDGARGVTLHGNTFWMGYDENLLVENSTQIVAGANAFERNPAYDYGNATTTKNAVIFRDCRDCTLQGLHIQGVTADAGLLIERCSRMNVTGCTVLDCDGPELLLRNVTDSRVSGCLLQDDRAEGERGVFTTEDCGNVRTDETGDVALPAAKQP
ncbi:MAG TPA: right-handed parallel beta-helix repeat-containing protein [Pirellulaceae bacterium]|nr:right-handed parallel beta-helix repeat-containing protein [Pirellulaceae bacterium]